jgi:hypothetical protein
MLRYVKSYVMPAKKKSTRLSSDDKAELLENTVETLWATNKSWGVVLEEKTWRERIFLIEKKTAIEKII